MRYQLHLDEREAKTIRLGLGRLPYDDVAELIASIGTQLAAQEKLSSLPRHEELADDPNQPQHGGSPCSSFP